MRVLLTGVAGFIGSNLTDKLLRDGHKVIGVDCFTDYYAREFKERNIVHLRGQNDFSFIEADLLQMDLQLLVADVDVVIHLAAQAGVRNSWGTQFDVYLQNNIWTTQKLLEVCKGSRISKFIYASSSSVYGNVETYPVDEKAPTRPFSPYGVTKLAAEHLSSLYCENYNVPTVALRFFTVYGPRQRPDMAFHKFIRAAMKGEPITVYGDGKQTRDFTYVGDIVNAIVRSFDAPTGNIYNIGGGNRVSVIEVIGLLREIMDRDIQVKYVPNQKGDVRDTSADISKAKKDLDYVPQVSLKEGLEAQIQWLVGMGKL